MQEKAPAEDFEEATQSESVYEYHLSHQGGNMTVSWEQTVEETNDETDDVLREAFNMLQQEAWKNRRTTA